MTDQLPGLGWLASPPDERDFPIDQLYALRGIEKPLTVPAEYVCPGTLPAITDQDGTPQCVAYSTSELKGYEDRIDQGQFFAWDQNTFFTRIGGGPNGAYVRSAYDRMLKVGYPLIGNEAAAIEHRIAAYYSVPITTGELQAGLMAFGPIVIGIDWDSAFDNPPSNGMLRKPSGVIRGGHAILLVGWKIVGGVTCWILRNSWGTGWGVGGECYLPFAYLTTVVGEAWKAVDVIENPPIPPSPPFTPRTAMGYTPLKPVRLADSRLGTNFPALVKPPKLQPGLNAIAVGGMAGVPTDAVAVALKIEVISPAATGWIEAGPESAEPGTSVNWFPADTGRAFPMNFIGALASTGLLYIWLGSAKVPVDWDLDVRGIFTT